jgi:CTD kinase subunit beta
MPFLLGHAVSSATAMSHERDERERPHADSESVALELPAIHPSFIQVAKPYVFEQTIQDCIQAMGVNPMREESLRLQGVSWIDNVRKVLHLYVQHVHSREQCIGNTN